MARAKKRSSRKKGTRRSTGRKAGSRNVEARLRKVEEGLKKTRKDLKVVVGVVAEHGRALRTGGLLSGRARHALPKLGGA